MHDCTPAACTLPACARARAAAGVRVRAAACVRRRGVRSCVRAAAQCLRVRTTDPNCLVPHLPQELKAQEARFASLDAQLAEARAALASGAGASAPLSPSQVAMDALWAAGNADGALANAPASAASPLDRDPWSAAVASSASAADVAAPASAAGGTWGFRRAAPPPQPPAPPAPPQAPPGPARLWGILEGLATAAASSVARLRSPEAARTQLEGLRLKLKSDLLLKVAPLDRGAAATTAAKLDVEALVAALAEVNPTPAAAASGLSDGRWNVVYTTSGQLLGSRLPDFLRPSGPLYLTLNSAEARAALDCTWPLKAERARLTIPSPTSVALEFESVKLFRFFTLPVGRVREYSFLETVYLDLDLRILRGGGGTLYILIMENPFYKIADGDRGFGQALPPGKEPRGARSGGTGKKGGA
jgi:hypothetical protein